MEVCAQAGHSRSWVFTTLPSVSLRMSYVLPRLVHHRGQCSRVFLLGDFGKPLSLRLQVLLSMGLYSFRTGFLTTNWTVHQAPSTRPDTTLSFSTASQTLLNHTASSGLQTKAAPGTPRMGHPNSLPVADEPCAGSHLRRTGSPGRTETS